MWEAISLLLSLVSDVCVVTYEKGSCAEFGPVDVF